LIEIGPMPPGAGQPATRAGRLPGLTERHVLVAGLAITGSFVAAALVAAVGTMSRGGNWAALHLAVAGAATVAIGTFMPHFAVTLAGTRPARAAGRIASLLCLGLGGLAVVVGVLVSVPRVTATGTAFTLVGLAAVALHVLAPLRDPLARRHPVVTVAYGLALLELAAAVALGGLGATGAPGVLDAWARIRPIHAWLGLFGAISLTIFATLVYLVPTVVGARVRGSVALAIAFAGIAFGPLVTIAGFAAAAREVVVVGMAVTALGAIGQLGYVADNLRRRGRFAAELGWRRVVVGHLLAGPAWFAAACAVALAGVVGGAGVVGWTIGLLTLPMIAGWLMQELVGSWTHLVPAVTPGDARRHARQRTQLAVGGRARLVAWNVGLALLWLGAAMGALPLAASGGALFATAAIASVAILARALTMRG
jgi:hypothetical protein